MNQRRLSVDSRLSGRLRERLVTVHRAPGYGALLANLVLERLVAPDASAYGDLENLAADAERRGYATIA